MKSRNLVLGGAVVVGLGLAFWVGTCGGPSPYQADGAAGRSALAFDSLHAAYQDRLAGWRATADSLSAQVSAHQSALDSLAVRNARAEAAKAEADATVRRFAEAGAGVAQGKGQFDLTQFRAMQGGLAVTDTLVAGLREQVRLLGEQNDALRAQNDLLRAQLHASDSVVAQAQEAVETAHRANLALQDAVHRSERARSLWRGATFAAGGAALVLGVVAALPN